MRQIADLAEYVTMAYVTDMDFRASIRFLMRDAVIADTPN